MKNIYYYEDKISFDNSIKPTDTVYSDRLYQLDWQKYNMLCMKYFNNEGQYWSNRKASLIESFLRDYTDNQNLILCRVEEYENVATAYPYWRFDYKLK